MTFFYLFCTILYILCLVFKLFHKNMMIQSICVEKQDLFSHKFSKRCYCVCFKKLNVYTSEHKIHSFFIPSTVIFSQHIFIAFMAQERLNFLLFFSHTYMNITLTQNLSAVIRLPRRKKNI